MQIRMRARLCAFFLLFLLNSKTGNSQEINVNLSNVDSLILTNTEYLVFDVNGEICSMIIITTDLEGLKFYSNLGIEKIQQIENGYRIWIPNQTTVIKIYIPGFPLFEYTLPRSDFKYSVYIISLKAEKTEKVILKDTIQQKLSFVTIPEDATIFLNGLYLGKSPKVIEKPDFDKFEYLIKKRGFSSFSSKDSMDRKIKNISIELDDLTRKKRYFLIFNVKWDGLVRSQVDAHGMKGITFGVFGETGYYGSLNYLSVNEAVVTTSHNSTYPEYFNYNKGQKVSLVGGISRQLGKSVFIYGGPGYIRRTYQREGYLDGKSESLILNTGFVFRIGWYSLLQIDFNPGINHSYSSIGFGLGINFPKKSKDLKIND